MVCGSSPTLDCEFLGPCVLQTASSNAFKDWHKSMASLTHSPNSSERTRGCSEEVVLDELSICPEPLAATTLGGANGGAAGGVLGNGLENGM